MPKTYHVDAFAEKPFEGNPAGVCLLDEDKPSEWMQSVATEMNLSATAFIRSAESAYDLRWFTPVNEIQLCGHGTLASAHILWSQSVVANGQSIRFQTKGGTLTGNQAGNVIELDFPALPSAPADPPAGLLEALDVEPSFVGQTKFDRFLVLASEEKVRNLKPDFAALGRIEGMRGVIVTSRSSDPHFDFVSRFFAPALGLNEDPVTGSAHCALAPFWATRLGKSNMTGFQASSRGGIVRVRVNGDRVVLGGQAITILSGQLL
jgi:PhzF family phenazine biosynthesis protein